METNQQNSEPLDENQTSQEETGLIPPVKVKIDGILFIVWGWIGFLTYFIEYVMHSVPHSYQLSVAKGYFTILLAVFGVIYSLFYIYKKRNNATKHSWISLQYVWLSMFAAMVLLNLIQYNIFHKINFELQLPVFMILVAYALTVTGAILRHRLIIAGGIVFGLLAYLASRVSLNQQLLIESIAWLVAFIIPGHILFIKRKKIKS